jgi:hypothetical protein
MKQSNPSKTSFRLALMLAAVAGLLWLPASVMAQTGTAKGGAGKLIQLKPIQTVEDARSVEPGDTVVMSCPKCKDSWATIVPPPGKTGAVPDVQKVMRHECPGCEHKFVTEGHGKAKTDKLVHVCKNCGSEDAFCCVMKKGSTTPTPGMEKK